VVDLEGGVLLLNVSNPSNLRQVDSSFQRVFQSRSWFTKIVPPCLPLRNHKLGGVFTDRMYPQVAYFNSDAQPCLPLLPNVSLFFFEF